MSLIAEQIRELINEANCYKQWQIGNRSLETSKILFKAADTIEALSAKLTAANMERSTAYYNNGDLISKSKLIEDIRLLLNRSFLGETTAQTEISVGEIATLINSQKVANMERSERYYGGGWIACSYKLPTEKGKYWITYFWGGKECVDISEFENGKFAFAVSTKADVIAWKPCVFPEPYKLKE